MAVVPDVENISPDGHGEYWLERDIPTVGAIYRLDPREPLHPNTILCARDLGANADFSAIRGWLSFCEQHHDQACQPSTAHEPISKAFRVINCTNDPPIVEEHPWGITYAALSYVWGKGATEDWPRTILDAVVATRELGLEYLWVDQLCIDQSNQAEKNYLISRMTTIYEAAHFTIVAAAGSGATYGLPGVRTTPRRPQPKIKLDSGSILVSSLKDPRREIFESDYSTRGWTYQEGILSNRHIVFTDYQVYWECRCMAVSDAIYVPLELVHEDSGLRMADYMQSGIFKTASNSAGVLNKGEMAIIPADADRLEYGFSGRRDSSILAKLRGLDEHIRAFSARQLSYDEDSLTAFLGIAGMYKANRELYLLHGIPMWIGSILGGHSGAQITFALSVSSWYHRSASDQEVFVIEPCRRRNHLPSWSWAGWKGTVSWRAPPSDDHAVFMGDLIEYDTVDIAWAADIHLHDVGMTTPICLREIIVAGNLEADAARLLEVKNPLILKYSNLHSFRKQWEWRRLAGRHGRAQFYADRTTWDSQWRRLAGRLVSIGLSVPMTLEQWSAKHYTGEIVSVLMFAGRIPSNGHGRARFLTVRRVPTSSPAASAQRWERIGTVQLIVAEPSLDQYKTNEMLLKRLPVYPRGQDLIIQ
ncbi:HET-domain-containing protein [Pleurostoma richardsiae]|uniref:HET-domain-containing protein n=1 Tax=Pleurostoma richardsiae TaxID=41990 RepID=A0AA38RSG4_9PEZI|nr:HET-domain-containing protein [Pleurostoma richardsiae]